MKQLAVLTSLSFLLMLHPTVNAGVVMDYQNLDTTVRPSGVERNLLLNSDDTRIYDIAVRPLEDMLRRSDGGVEIPLEYVYINNTTEDVYIRYNDYSNLFRSIQMGGVPKNLTAKVRDYGMIPAGNYYLAFEIQALDTETQNVVSTSTFNLCFNVPVTQSIDLNGEIPKITVSANDAFVKDKKIANESSPMITINSNCDWELIANADNFGEGAGNYYIRTISASNDVSERLQERVLLEPGREIIIAKGKAPANMQNIAVEISMEPRAGEIFHAGNFDNKIIYTLREVK